MVHSAHLAQLLQKHAAHLAPAPGTFAEEDALAAIDAARDQELAGRDRERARRQHWRATAQRVRERRGQS